MNKKAPRILSIALIVAMLLAVLPAHQAGAVGPAVFINEIHYDNASTDTGEAIEVAGPAGTDLTGWSVALYNGSATQLNVYDTINLSGVIPDQVGGYGTLSFARAGIQNGSPDGLALVDSSSTVIQFLSYEGSFTAGSGPASGMTSTDIGVSEPGTTPIGDSLQLTGSGSEYGDFTWSGPSANTIGSVNTGQTFVAGATPPFVNELHYDNTGADAGEGIEVAGQSGMDLSGWSIELYNGNGGSSYGTIALSGSIPDQDNGFGTLWFAHAGIQNGAPDGFALVDPSSNVLQFFSYEGDFTAVGGPADGMTSTDIGVSEASGSAVGNSLQLIGAGSIYEDFAWASSQPNTFGAVNSGQSFLTGTTVTDPVINEFVANHTGTDTNEFVEVVGDSNTDYSAFTIVEIEGEGSGTGQIDDGTITVGTSNADGFWRIGFQNNLWENGTMTLLLVEDFTGSVNQDLDTNNDGVLDVTPWTRIVDDVAVSDGGASDLTYSSTVLNRGYDSNTFTVGGASRIPDGVDTDAVADWVRNDFDLFGIPGFSGSPVIGEAENTPGAENAVITVLTDPVGGCNDPATLIHDIQGSGLASGDVGSIREVEAVVVATFQDTNQIGGYFIQEEDADADADLLTSEGLRIFDPANTPTVGDVIRIRGSVTEFFGLTELNNVIGFAVCGSDVATPSTVTLPVTSIDDFERYEGMAVTFPQELVISEYFNFDRYGEIVLTTARQYQPTASFEPGSTDAANLALANSLSRITLDDGRGNQNPDPAIHPNGAVFDLTNLFRGGDTVANVTGVLDYNFGLYKIQPTQGADYISINSRTALPDDVGGDLKVASFNVLNYFTTLDNSGSICGPDSDQGCRGADNATEFTRQRDKIIAALNAIDADVVGLMEIENHPEDVPTADLVSGLNDVMGADTYDYVATGAIGIDAIRQAFIYKPATVSLVGDYAVLDDQSFTNPLGYVDDDGNPEEKSRPALAQTFMDNETGGVFTTVVNHLKSKGSACGLGDDDPEQGSCNLTRTMGAQALVDWLASDPTGSYDPDFLIIGDLNSYDKEEPIDALLAGGYTDLAYYFHGEEAYSYVFNGQIGYLDYALAGAGLQDEVTGVAEWHINADEADLIDYDTSFKGPNQDAIYAPDAYRSSDHDPIIVGLGMTTEQEIQELIDAVQKLIDNGTLNGGQGNALISKLENVLAKLAKGKTNAAANQLGAFINQVEDFVSNDILTAEQGDALIIPASALVGVLSK